MLSMLVPIITLMTPPPLPTVVVDRDNVEIVESCVIEVSVNPIIDADGNGVIHITRGNVTVDFAQQQLHGGASGQTPDTFAGTGIRIAAKNVTLKNASVSGYKVGIHAVHANGLTIRNCNVSNNFHQRLKSTPQAEDETDWLWPHANDDNEWMTNYGAGLCVEDSEHVTLHDIRARKTQNGIILDRVNDSKVYDCDCSFLSGWGLAMWRSNRNVISRNAFDFCVRGYSHGVYNRGQDSAGILMFEQCSENVIAENSCTHGGDGFFGFAGKEALGEVNPQDDQGWYKRRGCNDNVFVRNDFSFAVAHGLEMTFSFGNRIHDNTFFENAICGVWGGYSRDTIIDRNAFRRNGKMAYGLERGGINVEHGAHNVISGNRFEDNKCGVHLWWDDDEALLSTPWARANAVGDEPAAIIRENHFQQNNPALHLRHMRRPVFMARNTFEIERLAGGAERSDAPPEHAIIEGDSTAVEVPADWRIIENLDGPELAGLPGATRPAGAREQLRGRKNIIMTEWGPWEHASPLLQFMRHFDTADEYRLRGAGAMPAQEAIGVEGEAIALVRGDLIGVLAKRPDTLTPYRISFDADGPRLAASGVLTGGSWRMLAFASSADPREDEERWRAEGIAHAKTILADALDLRFGSGGIGDALELPLRLPADHFGVIVTRSLTIPAGKWRITTLSDDGIRVWMNDQLAIDDWAWHGPTKHDHEFELAQESSINFRVEYFELDGHAVLTLDIQPR